MDMLDSYKIDLKNMRSDKVEYQFALTDAYFEAVQGPEVQKGHVDVNLRVKRTAGAYELTFCIDGIIQIPCDRCLELMDQKISTESVLKVKLGLEYVDEGELRIIPEEDGILDVSWLMYEMIALEIPMKHVHEPGLCNGAMMGTLAHMLTDIVDEEHLEQDTDAVHPVQEETDGNRPIDPRWNELKKILDNN